MKSLTDYQYFNNDGNLENIGNSGGGIFIYSLKLNKEEQNGEYFSRKNAIITLYSDKEVFGMDIGTFKSVKLSQIYDAFYKPYQELPCSGSYVTINETTEEISIPKIFYYAKIGKTSGVVSYNIDCYYTYPTGNISNNYTRFNFNQYASTNIFRIL